MVTQELLSYVRSEFVKGKSRADISAALRSGGGWSEEDINEVFKAIDPVATTAPNPSVAAKSPAPFPPSGPAVSTKTPDFVIGAKPRIANTQSPKSHSKIMFFAVPFMLGILIFVAWYFFKPDMSNALGMINSSIAGVKDKVYGLLGIGEEEVVVVEEPIIELPKVEVPVIKPTKNCGTTKAPDRSKQSLSGGDAVMVCLGDNAVVCDPATAVLEDPLFPTQFRVLKEGELCKFELSYPTDSKLVDVFGKSLAGRKISCPVSVVKSISETTTKSTTFVNPTTENLGKYASDIYFYGTLGVFIENNFNRSEIEKLGCGGDFVTSVIESYNLMKQKKS